MPRNANQSKQSNYSLDFDGSQFVQVSSTNFGSGSFSISTWFNQETMANNTYQVLFAGQGYSPGNSGLSFYLYRNGSDNEVRVWTTLNGVSLLIITGNVNYNLNEWNHACITREYNGSWILYLNGSPIGSSVARNTDNFQSTPSYIGKNNYGLNFNGKISTTSIFDYALSQSQVTTLWGGGTSVSNPMALPSSPIAYYPLGTSAWNGEYLAENNAIGDYVFDFNNSQEINCGSNASLNQVGSVFTMSCWINTTSGSRGSIMGTYINSGSGYYIDLMASGTVQGGYHQGAQYYLRSSSSTVNDGNWHHVCYVGSNAAGGFLNVYIDGVLNQNALQQSGPPANANSTNPFKINLDGYLGNRYTGKTSNVQVFSLALSATEVETLYNYGSPIQTLANIPQSSNLKAWYKLDATEIYNNSTTEWSIDNNQNPSAYPSSLDFNGSSNYINLDSFAGELSTGDAYGLSVWFKGDGNNNTDGVLFSAHTSSRGNVVRLLIRDLSGSTVIQYLDGGNNGFFQGDYDNNKWHNVVVTKSTGTSTLTLYIDGSSIGTISNCNPDFSNATLFSIGQEWDASGTGDFFSGQISNVQIFNTALTDGTGGTVNQIETLYNNGNPLTDMSSFSSLVSWWKLDNTTTGIEDSKGTNNGTNNGATKYAGFVNTLAGESSGMSESNLVQSDLQTVAPYSKYALSFDGANDYIDCGATVQQPTTNYSVSCWVKLDSVAYCAILGNFKTGVDPQVGFVVAVGSGLNFEFWADGNASSKAGRVIGTSTPNSSTWYNVVGTYNGSLVKIYVNNVLENSVSYSATPGVTDQNLVIGRWYGNYDGYYTDGSISNVSIWNTALTSSQVSEIYNEGLPSNLNNHSAYSNLVSWWQLGSNSSWNGNRWIVADEKGTNNGYSQNMSPYMPESGLTNGVGTTANGVSSGMSEGSLVGNAPYSTANAISSGMPVTARGTDVPPTP